MRPFRTLAVVTVAAVALSQGASAQRLDFTIFERYLDSLRLQAGIPGLSAAIVHNGQTVWERGFGSRDLEASLPAFPDTPYLITDVTQTVAGVLVMKCVERGIVDLDDPVGDWSPTAPERSISVRHVLAHANPNGNTAFRYDPSRYAHLGAAVELCGRRPARQTLTLDIFERFGMVNSVPGRDIVDLPSAREWLDSSTMQRYQDVLRQLAVPYRVDRRGGRATRSEYPAAELTASTGLVSSARDLAKFHEALDTLDVLREETLALSWRNATVGSVQLPTALGWFAQNYEGQRVIWHFGYAPDAYSSLVLKVPGKRLTLILLANSDGLSAPFNLHEGDITTSVFALAFLRLFA